MNVRAIRLAAALLPSALALHEGAYALGGGEVSGAHGYLAHAAPLVAALAVSLALAALLLPLLGARPGGAPDRRAPFALAGSLLAIFFTQEVFETVVLGGGPAALAAALSVIWIALPFALLFGTLAAQLIVWLERAGDAIAALACGMPLARQAAVDSALPAAPARSFAPSPLAFGLARRPPPALA